MKFKVEIKPTQFEWSVIYLILMYIGAGAPFWMGTVCRPLIGEYGQQLAYAFGGFLLVVAMISTVLVYKMRTGEQQIENGISLPRTTITIAVLMILIVAVLFGSVIFVHDRYVNPQRTIAITSVAIKAEGHLWGGLLFLKLGSA
jgi:hypothetical protein